ncbi:poly(A)-binding protein binding protein, partial [Elasticomyces elasticus]
MADQAQAKNSKMSATTKIPPPPQRMPPSTPDFQYLSELDARLSAEKVRFVMLKRLNDWKDRGNMIEGLKRFGAEFKLSTPVPEDLVELMAGTEEKRAEILRRGRSDGGKLVGGGDEEVLVEKGRGEEKGKGEE